METVSKGFTTMMPHKTKRDLNIDPHDSTIQTPLHLSAFIYNMIRSEVDDCTQVIDPCVGRGNLLKPWKDAGYETCGFDKIDYNDRHSTKKFSKIDFLKVAKVPDQNGCTPLVLCNPPWNHDGMNNAHRNGKKSDLLPHIFLKRIIHFWGKDAKIVFITCIGLINNLRRKTPRLTWFIENDLNINGIIILPLDIFVGAEWSGVVLFMNIPGIQPVQLYSKDSSKDAQLELDLK